METPNKGSCQAGLKQIPKANQGQCEHASWGIESNGYCWPEFSYNTKLVLRAFRWSSTEAPRYVRASEDGTVFVAPIDSKIETDATDAEFRRVRGLAEQECISFESTKFSGHYLFYLNNRVRLGRIGFNNLLSDLARRATFCPTRKGLEALHDPGSFLYIDGKALKVDKYERTYIIVSGGINFYGADINQLEGPSTLGLIDGNRNHRYATFGGITTLYEPVEGDYQVEYVYSECSPEIGITDIINWWAHGTPLPRSTAIAILEYSSNRNFADPNTLYRIVTHSAQSIPDPATGQNIRLVPLIKLFMPYEGVYKYGSMPVAKIETGQVPCGLPQ